MFSIHTGMLRGQERKLNFLGATGPQILFKQTNQGGESCPAFPTCYTKSAQERKPLALQSSQALTTCTHGSGGLNRCQCSKMRPPTRHPLLPVP